MWSTKKKKFSNDQISGSILKDYDYDSDENDEEEEDEDEEKDVFYTHKIATIVSGSTQDSVDQCTSLLCKMLAVPTSSSLMDHLSNRLGNNNPSFSSSSSSSNKGAIEELTLKMEDKSFYKIGRYLIKLSTYVDLNVGLKDDFIERDDVGESSFGRIPDKVDDGNLDMVIKGKFDTMEISAFNEKTKAFKSREETGRHHHFLQRQFVTLPMPQRKFYSDQRSFERSKRSFDKAFERMKTIDYYILSLKCSKIIPPSRHTFDRYYSDGATSFLSPDAEEIMYANDPLMLTSTLEHVCGQICTSIYVFDLEFLVGIRHEIWTTETELHNLMTINNNAKNKLEIDIVKEEEKEEEEEERDVGFSVIGDPLSESDLANAIAALTKKQKRLETAYALAFQQEKNKLYNTISLEGFVKRPWIFVFYLPFHCYQAVRGKKDNNGFDFHAMICEISVRMLETASVYDYFLKGTQGARVYATFVNCGFDILDEHVNGVSDARHKTNEIYSKRHSFEVYKQKKQRFYIEAKRLIRSTPNVKKSKRSVEHDKLMRSIVLVNNDEMSSFTKKLAYAFYTKDRFQKYPVLTKINIKKTVK